MEKFIDRVLEFQVKQIKIRVDDVNKPSGKLTRRLVVDYPDAVAIIPFLPPDHVIMVRQFRYALNQETLEFPAGKIDQGETPEQAVIRELLEETGYKAEKLHKLLRYAPAMGYSSERIHMFFASHLTQTDFKIDPDEINKIELIPVTQLWQMIKNNLALDPKITIGYLLAEKLDLFNTKEKQ